MKGSETKLAAFMQGADKRFIIPVYQRNYDWKTENCKQLYDDLVKVERDGRKSHFFGSIVSVHNPDGQFNEHLVIDGQQRLTTISLLLLAMYNLLERKAVIPRKSTLSERIYEEYLVDKWQDDETRIKLKPVKNDQTAFMKLFEADSEHIQGSNLTANYNYFYQRIQKEEIPIDGLFDAICRLEIISITLNQDDNPQLIFESLNSTGLALSEGDKIRNYILMGLPTKQQNDFYEKYWNKIEICTDYDVSSFIRDYLSIKQQNTPSMSKIYFTFKAYVSDEQIETEQLLKDLLDYARWYEILLRGQTNSKALNACIDRLNRLETTVTRPFFMEVLRLQAKGSLTIEQTTDVFLTTESYLFRRTICDLPTNTLNKTFLLLHREIIRYDGTENDYVAKFKYALLSKKERIRFPDDAEFVEKFSTRPIYSMNTKNKVYIMERFENNGTDEDKDIYRHCDDGDYSIEHIMPQHLTPIWVRELGSDYEQIHETWLHRIGNLTLTAYNSKYSNSSFDEKKTMKNGFSESGIRLNAYVAQQDHWTLEEMEERTELLMSRAVTIWPLPVTHFAPSEKQFDNCTLEDDVNLSGRIIARYSYKGIEQPVTSWIDMYERILKMLHTEDPSVLAKLAYEKGTNADLATYVSNQPTDLRSALEIDPGIYTEKNTSTETKVVLLRKFFKKYGADPGDLVFYLRDEDESNDDVVAAARYELRKKYWTFALGHIQAAHDDGKGCFKNVSPSKDNWISGFFGIGGFSISCVANYDMARVELSLSNFDKDKNKAAFDSLYAQRAAIEQSLGTPLVWDRSDKTKASYVRIRLDGVSIEQEADWTQMAKFHAEWSRKFFDVLVPLLKNH